jgi:outer membrane protein with beta-barrel domain
MTASMRQLVVAISALIALCPSVARAQEPPPKIGPFVLDLHATVPRFPNEDSQLAQSRGMDLGELPGAGLGVQVGAHVYVLRIKVITFGLGAEAAVGRARQTPASGSTLKPTEERFSTFAPQLSFNFGNGHGWSYLSGGLGVSNWALVHEGDDVTPADTEALKTLNYGGGARWFAKPHLAFSLDVRIYAISPGTPYLNNTGSPRTNLLVIGAGVSIK